jgi:hypothetical protein
MSSALTVPGNWVSYDANATTVLTYAVLTDPSPLTVSASATEFTTGSIEVVVTNNSGKTVTVNSIAFAMVVGNSPPALMQSTTGLNAVANDTTNFAKPAISGSVTVTLNPAQGLGVNMVNGQSVVIQMFGFPTILTPGTGTLTITETTSNGVATNTINITTFPAGFYFNNVVAQIQKGVAFQPVAVVPSGTLVTLTWNSSVASTSGVQIFWTGGGSTPVTPTLIDQWTTPSGLTVDTVFTVVVTAAVTAGQPITASLSVPVSVLTPSLVAASVNTGTLTVNSAATVSGLLTTTNFTLTTKSTQVGATAVITAPVPTPGSGTPATASYTAPTDGFVFGFVGANSSGQSTQLSVGYILIQNSQNAFVSATGGNFLAYVEQNPPPAPAIQFSQSSLNQSIFLPVRAGESFTVSVTFNSTNQATPQTNFWFIPIGSGTLTTSAANIGSVAEAGPATVVSLIQIAGK